MKKTSNKKIGKSRYALRILKRKRISKLTYETLNNNTVKKMPVPLPLLVDNE